MKIEKLKYPIGKPNYDENNLTIKNWINIIKDFPIKVANEVIHLTKTELNYTYRPKGWNIKQLVGHCIDSHINSVIRFKLTLTEENPIIKPYKEAKWANLNDTINYDIKSNIELLKAIHQRWVFLLERLTKEDLNRTFIHPEGNEKIALKENLCIYAWHCEHHLQHILNAKKYKY